MTDPKTRSIEMERELDAPPEEVWELLTTSEGLRTWFPMDARVGEKIGDEVWLSWGEGCEGAAPIHVKDDHKHFGWSEELLLGFPEEYADGEEGSPRVLAIDFYLEGRDGKTVLRLVQSGLSADSQWDEMYDAMVDGWTYFLFNLAWYCAKHRGRPRRMVWKRIATDLSRDAVWERLVQAALVGAAAPGGGMAIGDQTSVTLDSARVAEVVSVREGHHFAATLPDLDDSVLFVELEGKNVGFWLSTYRVDEAKAAQLQAALDRRLVGVLDA